jgi:hypothetical protein
VIGVILAELEVCHSRPIAPTRRIALGDRNLPVDPPPGFGGLLLAGIVATFAARLDDELFDELGRLVRQIERGQRVAQPRLRHRFQHDLIGLTRVRHRLHGEGELLRFDIDDGSATPAQHVLGAVYAIAEMRPVVRERLVEAFRVAMHWNGPVGLDFIARVTGHVSAAAVSPFAVHDPVGWARLTLGLALEEPVTNAVVQSRFREQLRQVHPDHGGKAEGAAQRIAQLAEARRILLT